MKRATEHINSVIKTLIKKMSEDAHPTREEVENVWKETAGEAAFRHTKPRALRKKCLIINVDGSSWLYELTLQKESLLAGMKKGLGQDKIKELQFRIGDL